MTARSLFENPPIESSKLTADELDSILGLHRTILNATVTGGDSPKLLDDLCLLAESFTPNSVASVMLYDPQSDTLKVKSGPSLSPEAVDAFNGLRNGDGSCGNAVYHNEAMYVCNTFKDARWQALISVAEQFDICACFSFPIRDADGNAIGSFAISSFEHRKPNGFHRSLLETCTAICGVVLQRLKDREMSNLVFQERLRAEKLSSLGVLAGGIAHDFNNLLGSVLGNVDLALSDTPPGPAHDSLDLAIRAIRRASELTQQLLAFSRGGAPIRKPNRIGDVIRDSSEFALRGSNVALNIDANETVRDCVLNIDGGQIGQIIQNLTINARQAMPTGGTVSISYDFVTLLDHPVLEAGEYLQIDVVDEGTGIPADLQEKIFDPYFTTSEGGTGLGLAVCYSVAKNHGGGISVESEEGSGSRFTVLLPRDDSVIELESGKDVAFVASTGGRVIVMDDDTMSLETAGKILGRLGYEVTEARDGKEVLQSVAQAATEGDEFELAILDLTIPGGMGGVETKEALVKIAPNLKLVVASGYSDDTVLANHHAHGFHGAVAKPYRVAELQKVISDVIQGGSRQDSSP